MRQSIYKITPKEKDFILPSGQRAPYILVTATSKGEAFIKSNLEIETISSFEVLGTVPSEQEEAVAERAFFKSHPELNP